MAWIERCSLSPGYGRPCGRDKGHGGLCDWWDFEEPPVIKRGVTQCVYCGGSMILLLPVERATCEHCSGVHRVTLRFAEQELCIEPVEGS